jgi:hypothetical protein
MRPPRILVAAVAAASALSVVPPAGAGELDDCAQRVIRDWYSGGRIDGVYPLACYRAAIRALPEDVLQYSNADADIARALAAAQRRRVDGGNAGKAAAPEPAPPQVAAAPDVTEPPGAQPAPQAQAPASRARASTRDVDRPASLADRAEVDTASTGLPYPVLALAALAVLLLASAAAAALRARRR